MPAPAISPVTTSQEMPRSTSVAIIGGGIVGLTAALTLAERGIPAVVLEKGRIAAEQSSRNLGWIRKTNRAVADVPIAAAADTLWAKMPERVGSDLGYRRNGIMFVAGSDAEMAMYSNWVEAAREVSPDSRLLTADEVDALVPGGTVRWQGGVYTPSDGYAEPTLASSMIARAAMEKGAQIIENCAVRTLSTSGGQVRGVVTERGEIAADHVILAGGMGSRRFLDNLGVAYPTLPLICYALRTAPMDGPTDIAVGAPDFSFRKHADGGFVITHRAALGAPITLDHLLIGTKYWGMLKHAAGMLRYQLGKPFLDDWNSPRRWTGDSTSPFELTRITDPDANADIAREALANCAAAWPAFAKAEIAQSWAGTMDITPDNNPVIDEVAAKPGLTLATGFSGHGFGTGPAAGQLAADIATGHAPLVDPAPYRLSRFTARSAGADSKEP
ncbi:NAD(P)/FAD-dependent oxidoreductase [Aurantiacibacter rhizosphaerae]|uniref:FAD-dependent oxidoreductase n=1 Tax=Aurantiacibacter rhizosphaerae TaxID=2691582 RepID=A0A844XEZ0_9SPHN|nr:FAD-binding oxidoreductase [Aurantiacibacter rhizosphaerae]MWV29047.1 FAD-dependent oxidoreductase [Aurantiacibacter rhizosphaerae]